MGELSHGEKAPQLEGGLGRRGLNKRGAPFQQLGDRNSLSRYFKTQQKTRYLVYKTRARSAGPGRIQRRSFAFRIFLSRHYHGELQHLPLRDSTIIVPRTNLVPRLFIAASSNSRLSGLTNVISFLKGQLVALQGDLAPEFDSWI